MKAAAHAARPAPAVCPPLREVRLYGHLGRRFGRTFRLAVATAAEAAQALCAVLPGFEAVFAPGRYHVFVGRGKQRRDVGEHEAADPLERGAPICIVPVIAGAKRGGLFQTIIGATLIFLGLPQFGVPLIIGGVIQMLSPQRMGADAKPPENQPSYAFDGPLNLTDAGSAIPMCFGRVVTGSVVVSQGLSAVDIVPPAIAAPLKVLTAFLGVIYWGARNYPSKP